MLTKIALVAAAAVIVLSSASATFAGPIGTPVSAPAATPISMNISTEPPVL